MKLVIIHLTLPCLASPFLCAAIAFHGDYLATGTVDGIVSLSLLLD